MRTHSLMCRWWWLAPVAVLALGLGGRSKDATPPQVTDRNLVNTTDKDISLDFSLEKDSEMGVLWKARLGKTSYAGPVIAGGKIFVGTNNENPRDPALKGDAGVIMCFEEKSGHFLWQSVHDVLDNEAQNNAHQGIASTPFVEGNRVYYVSNRCELVCADANGDPKKPGKAKILWTLDMIKELKVFPSQLACSSPVVYGDLVFAVTGNGLNILADPAELPSPDAPSFVAVDKRTGRVRWTNASPGKNIMQGQWTGPAIVAPKGSKPQVLFPGGDGWLYSFEAETGKLIWKFDCNPKSAVYAFKNKRISDKSYFVAIPLVWEDRVYIGVGCNPSEEGHGVGHLWCIDPAKTPKNADRDLSPATIPGEKPKDRPQTIFDPKDPKNKDSGLVWHFGGKIEPEPKKGRKFYFGRTVSNCAIHEGLLYIPDNEGYFYCLDAQTGERFWDVDLKSPVWASPYVVDGKVFIGNEQGDLHVLAHGKTLKKLAKIDVGPAVKTPIKVVNGVLYVLTEGYLFAVKPK